MSIQSRDLKRQRLVDSAKEAFANNGYHETSISEIVRRAGIARSTFYQYFDSKLNLFESLLDSFMQDLHDSIHPISLAPGAATPMIQIQANLTRVLELILGERDLIRILMHHTGSLDRILVERLEGFYAGAAEMIQRSLKLGIATNLVRPCDTQVTSYSILGVVKEVVLAVEQAKAPLNAPEDLSRRILYLHFREEKEERPYQLECKAPARVEDADLEGSMGAQKGSRQKVGEPSRLFDHRADFVLVDVQDRVLILGFPIDHDLRPFLALPDEELWLV